MDCSWIGWCALKPEAQAAWAQAVLTVVTFAIALYVQSRSNARELNLVKSQNEKQEKAQAKQKQLLAKALSLTMIPDVMEITSSLTAIRDTGFDDAGARSAFKEWVAQGTHFSTITLSTPDLGAAAKPAQDLIHMLTMVRGYSGGIDFSGPLRADHRASLERDIPTLLRLARAAKEALTRVLAEPSV